MIVALAGRQNAGKTALMMQLTGKVQRPVNFPGSSVERGEARCTLAGVDARVVDLPGIASLSTTSRDEALAVEYLRGAAGETPDVVCFVADAVKLPVELRLLGEIMGLGVPVVVALTKLDVLAQAGHGVALDTLAARLGVPVVAANGFTGEGAEALAAALVSARGQAIAPWRGAPAELAAEVRVAQGSARASLTDRLDAVLLHRAFGLPILFLLFFGVFELIFVGAQPFIGAIEGAQAWLARTVTGAMGDGALQSLLVDGVINGVGSILVFLPQIVILIALIAALESSGYMARAAFLLDRILSRFGLSGRSFVPLLGSTACAVPGILAARIIEDENDRIATIVVSPLMSCSARLPVYVVLIGAFFPVAWAGTVLFALYAAGIVLAVGVAWLLRRTWLKGGGSRLMMELPVYQRPSARVVWAQVVSASRSFLVLAGTIIFATSLIIWVLSYYPRPEAIHQAHEQQRAAITAPAGKTADTAAAKEIDAAEKRAYLEQSFLARAGKAIQPVFAPAGFDWRITVGILAAFPARELIVPTLGILYSAGDVDPGAYTVASLDDAKAVAADGLRARLRAAKAPDGRPAFDPLIALALMVFFALCSQCAATLGAIRRETRSWRWPIFTFTYMTAFAWAFAVGIYQVGRALGYGVT